MCLLFFYYNPTPKPDEYKLVMVNNRDEHYGRPTKPACFWPEHGNIIGGTDQESGRKGGTWLAMNRNGKIACLLNIFQPKENVNPNAKGRGSLVKDFVAGNDIPRSYLEKIESEGDSYNGFLLFSMSIFKNELCYFTNMDDKSTQLINPGFHSFGNSPPARLWAKAVAGGEKFREIVEAYNKCSQKSELLEQLENMLKDRTQYPVDEQLAKQGKGYPESFLKKLHSVFVEIPESKYGTRCHTFILVDAHGDVEYIESSTGCIVDSDGCIKSSMVWNTIVEKFKLDDSVQ